MRYCVTIQRYQRIFMIQKVLSIPMNLSGAVDEAMFKSRLYTNKPVLVQVHRRDLYKRKQPRNARTGPYVGPVRALVYVRLGTGGFVKRLYLASYKWPRAKPFNWR